MCAYSVSGRSRRPALDADVAKDVVGVDDDQRDARIPPQVSQPQAVGGVDGDPRRRPGGTRRPRCRGSRRGRARSRRARVRAVQKLVDDRGAVRSSRSLTRARSSGAARSRRPRRGRRRCGGTRATPSAGCRASSRRPPGRAARRGGGRRPARRPRAVIDAGSLGAASGSRPHAMPSNGGGGSRRSSIPIRPPARIAASAR